MYKSLLTVKYIGRQGSISVKRIKWERVAHSPHVSFFSVQNCYMASPKNFFLSVELSDPVTFF